VNLPTLPPHTLQTPIGPTVGDLFGSGADAAIAAINHGVTSAALWLLDQVGHVLAVTTRPELGSGWFTEHFKVMADVAGLVLLPLLLLGIIQSVVRQDTSMLVRSVLVHLPLAIVLTGVAVQLVQLSLAAVDEMSAMVASATGVDVRHFVGSVGAGLQHPGGHGGLAPAFVVLAVAVVVAFGAFIVWIELLVRTAVISVAVLFLPLALVTLVWPVTAAWCRRLAETIAALILAKLVMVGVLSLAVGALTGGASSTPDVAGVVGGATLLVLAATSPFALLRVIPMVEAGAVAHLEGVGRRAASSVPLPSGSALVSALAGRGGGESETAADGAGASSGVAVAPGEPEPADLDKWIDEQAGQVAPPSVNGGDGPGAGAGAPDGAGTPTGPGAGDDAGAGTNLSSEAGAATAQDGGGGAAGQGDANSASISGNLGAATPGHDGAGPSGVLTGYDAGSGLGDTESGADSSAAHPSANREQVGDATLTGLAASPGYSPEEKALDSSVRPPTDELGPVGHDRPGNDASRPLEPDGGMDVGR